MRYRVLLPVCHVAAVVLLNGCASPETREIRADDPRSGVGIRNFEMQQDKVIVNSIGRKFTAADGKEADSLSVAVGDTFETTGFNTTEKWTLKKLQPTEAEFDVHRRCVSCCANPFTGQPDASKLHWIALVRFPQTQKPAEGKTELKTKARTPED